MKKLILLFLALLLATTALPMAAMADTNPYASLLDGPPEQFTPEALISTRGPNLSGFYSHGYDMAFFTVTDGVGDSGWTFEVVVQGDSVEYSGMAKAVFSDGTIVNGVIEHFADGERITIVLPSDKVCQGRYATVISFRGVRGQEASHAIDVRNGYVAMDYAWDAGASTSPAYGFPNGSPYAPTPRTGTGSIQDIFYTDSVGDLCITPNPNLSGNNSTEPPTTEPPSNWAVGEVNAAITEGLIPLSLQSGYTNQITRAEYCALAVMLYEKYTGAEITERITFIDTDDINVEKMAAVGVVEGVGENRFDPDGLLHREHAATMLSRLANALGKPLPNHTAAFADNAEVSIWAFEGVGQVQAAGIMGGIGNNTFAPKDPYTREQSIITMIRLWNIVR